MRHSSRFEYGRAFSEGVAEVEIDGLWGYIDKHGAFAINPIYRQTTAFSEGLAAVESENGLWGFIDKHGIEIIPIQFTAAWGFKDGTASSIAEIAANL